MTELDYDNIDTLRESLSLVEYLPDWVPSRGKWVDSSRCDPIFMWLLTHEDWDIIEGYKIIIRAGQIWGRVFVEGHVHGFEGLGPRISNYEKRGLLKEYGVGYKAGKDLASRLGLSAGRV